MARFSIALVLVVVSACTVGEISDEGTPGDGSSGAGGSSDGGGSAGGSSMAVTASIADVGVIPGDVANLTISLNRPLTHDLVFTYTTADGTALAGTNYTGVTSGSAMIAQGQLSAQIAIATSSTPGVLYLGKKFVVTVGCAAEPTLKPTATVSFNVAPPATAPHALQHKWAAFPASATSPVARAGHSAIWTGKKLIVWGGYSGTSPSWLYYGGAAYDPTTNNWTPISTVGAPSARSSHVAVWTGAKMIVWGGYNDTERYKNDGGAYDPATDTWSALPQNGAIPAVRAGATAVWNGARMIVWGGFSGPFMNDGAAYDPSTGTWVAISTSNAPSPRTEATSVWTGTRMIVWGGAYAARPIVDGIYNYYNDGAAYDPATNTWTRIASAGAPAARAWSSAAWTGTQMITWGGGDASVQFGDGGVYDPGSNVWSSMNASRAPANHSYGASVWTGSSFIYWGGLAGSPYAYLNDGGIYY